VVVGAALAVADGVGVGFGPVVFAGGGSMRNVARAGWSVRPSSLPIAWTVCTPIPRRPVGGVVLSTALHTAGSMLGLPMATPSQVNATVPRSGSRCAPAGRCRSS